MKTMIVTTPIRPAPTYFPPVGSLSLVNYLRTHGIDANRDVEFYNIDGNRPSYEDALGHIVAAAPDVVGISAVVSTAYAYTKRLTLDIKQALPQTLVVVGGNLAASAEILLRRTGTDLCVLGEGEQVFLDVVRRAETTRQAPEFNDIAGLVLLDESGKLVNTGYATPLKNDEIYNIDWRDLERSSDLDLFIFRLFDENERVRLPIFRNDPRVYEPQRRNKRFAILADGKGCVSRCTFCHRWDKGMRYVPIDVFFERLDALVERYDIGFLEPNMENFGNDKRWLAAFCEGIKKRDILWGIGSMRTRSVDPELLAMMKDAGCVAINYGIESGSQRMLDVMEKKATVQNNRDAHRWTVETGLSTVVALVLGMPGESPETVRESIDFCCDAFSSDPNLNPNNMSINYAQALPGTPLYEFARQNGMIGQDLDAEEEYLLRISDRDAHDEYTTLNFTNYPTLLCQTWRPHITAEVNYAFVEKFGIEQYRRVMREENLPPISKHEDDGYHANPRRITKSNADMGEPPLWRLLAGGRFGQAMISYPVLFYRLRHSLLLLVLIKNLARFSLGYNVKLVGEYLAYRFGWGSRRRVDADKSLRKIVWTEVGALASDNPAMEPLRRGR